MSNSPPQQVPSIGRTEPKARFWRNFEDKLGRDSYHMDLAPGYHKNLDSGSYKIRNNDVDSVWVPPNMTVKMWGDYRYNNGKSGNSGTYTSQGYSNYDDPWVIRGVKGLYSPIDLYKPSGSTLTRDDADTIQVIRNRSWDEHLNDCCTGKAQSEQGYEQWQCGSFKPGADVCKEFVNKCDGKTLKAQAQLNNGNCLDLCKANPTACNQVKLSYCKTDEGKADPWCSCINADETQEYKEYVAKVQHKYGVLPKKTCSAFGGCAIGADLYNMFLPTYLVEEQKQTCPPIDITDQSVVVDGDGNIIDVVQATGTGTDDNTDNTSNDDDNDSSDSALPIEPKYLLMIFIFIILILVLTDDDDSYDSPNIYSNYYPY